MMRRILVATVVAVWAAGLGPGGLRGASAAESVLCKPGRWVRVPAPPEGSSVAPGTATVVEPGHSEAQYLLPMSGAWAEVGSRVELTTIAEAAWLVAEVSSSPPPAAAREGLLRALPEGSQVTRLGEFRREVPESVDLVVCHDFAESRLQPQERTALVHFVRRGGAIFFLFGSGDIPSASVPLWRTLFVPGGSPEKQAPGLPLGVRVPDDFTLHFDEARPRLVWQRCGRGVVLAYGLAPQDRTLERAEETAALFGLAVPHVRQNRRPIALGPVEPAVFGLFEVPEWSRPVRRSFAAVALLYAAGAFGLLLSFGALLVRRPLSWVAGSAGIAAAGTALVLLAEPAASGLALDTAAVLIFEPGADPVEVVLGRVWRLAPGDAPRLRSADLLPPKLVLHSPFDASQKTWVNYRFFPRETTVQPLLDADQSLCLAAVRTLSADRARELASAAEAAPPTGAEQLINLARSRWLRIGSACTFRWVRPSIPPRLFDVSADGRFAQVHRRPLLVVAAAPAPVPAALPLDTPDPVE